MTTLYLVRHGQTEWNTERRMQGWQDSPLTALGIRQAQRLGTRLREVELGAIYASSAGRAMETARIVCGQRPLEIVADEDLREIGLGAWEGRVAEEVERLWPEQHAAFWHAPQRYEPVGGETFMQVRQRALAALERMTATHKGKSILVVTHTIVLKLLMAYCEARTLAELWDPPYIHEASLSIVRLGQGNPEVLVCGDTAHLA